MWAYNKGKLTDKKKGNDAKENDNKEKCISQKEVNHTEGTVMDQKEGNHTKETFMNQKEGKSY